MSGTAGCNTLAELPWHVQLSVTVSHIYTTSTIAAALHAGVRMRNIDVAALRAIFDLVQNHYPEHLDMMWFLNAPFIFRGAWKGISPFIAPATKEKLEFLSGGQGRTVLQSHISLEASAHLVLWHCSLNPLIHAILSHWTPPFYTEARCARAGMCLPCAPYMVTWALHSSSSTYMLHKKPVILMPAC